MASTQCVIDMEPFSGSDTIVAAPCGHAFHDRCIRQWLRNRQACPQCQIPLTPSQLNRLYLNINPDDVREQELAKHVPAVSNPGSTLNLSDVLRQLDNTEIELCNERDKHSETTRELEVLKTTLQMTKRELRAERLKCASVASQLETMRRRTSEEKVSPSSPPVSELCRHVTDNATRPETVGQTKLKEPSWFVQLMYLLLTIGALMLLRKLDALLFAPR